MFWHYFGNYLVERSVISQEQLSSIFSQIEAFRAKLGTIAVAEKLLTTKQADEINELQKQLDRKFGDIAVEKGYLLTEEVTYLLNLQGNPSLKFVQALTDKNIITLDEFHQYLEDYKQKSGMTDDDIDALRSGDIDRIIPIFFDFPLTIGGECISLALRNIVRFINSDVLLNRAYTVPEYSFGSLACQQIIGDHLLFLGLASKNDELLEIANPFAKEMFDEMNEDAFDSVCEFINCTNGLYASVLSNEDIHIDMTPPLFYKDKSIASSNDIYVIPIIINNKQSDLIIATNHMIEIV